MRNLFQAIEDGDLAQVKKCLADPSCDLNDIRRIVPYRTALMEAIALSPIPEKHAVYEEIALAIISHPRTEIGFQTSLRYNAFHAAAEYGSERIITAVLNRATLDGINIIDTYCKKYDRERQLLRNGVWYEAPALYLAASNGNTDAVKTLLNVGVSVDSSGILLEERNQKITPLIGVIKERSVQRLGAKKIHDAFARFEKISDGTEQEEKARVGVKMQEFSSFSKRMLISLAETIQILIDHGANLEVRDEKGLTPIERAVQCNDIEAVHIFLQAGVNPFPALTLCDYLFDEIRKSELSSNDRENIPTLKEIKKLLINEAINLAVRKQNQTQQTTPIQLELYIESLIKADLMTAEQAKKLRHMDYLNLEGALVQELIATKQLTVQEVLASEYVTKWFLEIPYVLELLATEKLTIKQIPTLSYAMFFNVQYSEFRKLIDDGMTIAEALESPFLNRSYFGLHYPRIRELIASGKLTYQHILKLTDPYAIEIIANRNVLDLIQENKLSVDNFLKLVESTDHNKLYFALIEAGMSIELTSEITELKVEHRCAWVPHRRVWLSYMNAKLLGASLLSVLETYCDNSVYTLINDEEKLLLTEFITLGKSGNHRLLQDPDLQRFMLNDQITGRQLIQFAPKMDFYLSSSRVRKVHELMSFGQLSIEQILKLPFVVFSDYCIDLVYFFKKGILTNAHFEKAAATAGFMVNTLCNVGVGALIKQGKLSVEQIVRAQHRIEHDIIRNAAVQKFISAGKLTSEFALVLARIVSSKNNGLNATDIKQLISNRELNIEHIISLTEFDGWRTFKSEIATANTLLAPAQHYSYISGAILPALDFNGESKGVVYGWWDSVPEIDSITHEPIFTYRLYQEIEYEDIEIGSAQFYGQKSFCQLGNEHNIIKTTGIFSQFPINSSNALETCEVLPPTFLERMIHSATQSAKHGAVRGIANVANYALTRSHQPKHVVKTAEFALYFSGLLLMTTYDNLNTFKNDRFPDVMTQSIFNTLIFMMTNLLIQFVCYGIKNLGEIAIQKEWRKTGEELIQLSRYASFGIYALNAKQNGVAMTMANIAAGSVSQFAVEKMGKTIVDYAFSR